MPTENFENKHHNDNHQNGSQRSKFDPIKKRTQDDSQVLTERERLLLEQRQKIDAQRSKDDSHVSPKLRQLRLDHRLPTHTPPDSSQATKEGMLARHKKETGLENHDQPDRHENSQKRFEQPDRQANPTTSQFKEQLAAFSEKYQAYKGWKNIQGKLEALRQKYNNEENLKGVMKVDGALSVLNKKLQQNFGEFEANLQKMRANPPLEHAETTASTLRDADRKSAITDTTDSDVLSKLRMPQKQDYIEQMVHEWSRDNRVQVYVNLSPEQEQLVAASRNPSGMRRALTRLNQRVENLVRLSERSIPIQESYENVQTAFEEAGGINASRQVRRPLERALNREQDRYDQSKRDIGDAERLSILAQDEVNAIIRADQEAQGQGQGQGQDQPQDQPQDQGSDRR